MTATRFEPTYTEAALYQVNRNSYHHEPSKTPKQADGYNRFGTCQQWQDKAKHCCIALHYAQQTC